MAQKKGYEVDAWLKRPDPRTAIVLVYGPDRGLVSERARAFAVATGLPLDDPFSVVRLDAGDIDREPGRLVGEARMVPMFSDRRLLWVRNAAAQKGLAEDVKQLAAAPAGDAVVLIEAGELKKSAPLRTAVEASPAGMALPCYADEARDVDALINAELAQAGMTMAAEAREALRANLGGDRLASRGEIQKLLLYAHGQREVGLDDVRALGGDVSGQSADEAIDCLLGGRIEEFDAAFMRQSSTPGQVSTLLAAAIRQLQTIQLLHGTMARSGQNAAATVAAARPPVFFARRRLVEQALERWTAEALERTLERLQTATLASRRRPDLAVAIVRQALLGSAIEARRR